MKGRRAELAKHLFGGSIVGDGEWITVWDTGNTLVGKASYAKTLDLTDNPAV